jgi:hypothetical protein
MPGAQFSEWHSRTLPGSPEQVWDALHRLRVRDLRTSVPLLWLRGMGTWANSDRLLLDPPSPAAPIHEEPPRTCTSGMISRPWHIRPTFGPEVRDLDQLRAFDDPGWLKFGMEWLLTPVPGGRTVVETSTVCEATDESARRRFTGYWIVIRPFSGVIRLDMLAALERGLRRSEPSPADPDRDGVSPTG